MNKLAIIVTLSIFSLSVSAQTLLSIPDTLSGNNFILNMHKDSVQFFPGKKSQTYAYNSNNYLGPTLIFNKGAQVNISVHNQINDTTTVHWHGIHLPSKWDGGPHTPILPGNKWHPTFTVLDNAATYWYHPHLHMKTAEQAIKGAAGLIIVRDPIEASLNLPRKYGVDDLPLIIQCQEYDTQNQAMPLGMQDSIILVNGARANYGYSVIANCPAQIVRMRILNASGERTFNFGLSNNKHFKVIANDGGLLNNPVDVTRIRLAPGERIEILVDFIGMLGQSVYLKSYASELPMGIQGGPTMPMPNGPPMNSPLNGIDFNILKINVTSQTSSPVTTIPSSLTVNNIYDQSLATATRTIRFTADSAMVMDGPFYFNDSTFNMDRIDYTIPINSIEKWKLVNETMVAHPFHIHDVQFYLLERNGTPPIAEESGRKDVVLIPPGDSAIFITKFEDFIDTIIPFMYHCHILMHEDAGMMGQFLVVPENFSGINNHLKLLKNIRIFPNPSSESINIDFDATYFDFRIVDLAGKVIQIENGIQNKSINISKLNSGHYFIIIKSNGEYYSGQFIKN